MPLGPCQTAYMPDMTASRTCAVQMFDVAFSRRICCSRVCSAKRRAGAPWLSLDTPTRRPGMVRLNASLQAMKPACGPPKPSGTPKRCRSEEHTSELQSLMRISYAVFCLKKKKNNKIDTKKVINLQKIKQDI